MARGGLLLLSGFHAWLFCSHLISGRLTEPAVAVRWVLGLLLAGGFLTLRRSGIPLARGRKAVVLWVLVAFLHAHAVLAPQGTITDAGSIDEAVAAFVLQAASATALLGVGLVLLGIALRPRARSVGSPIWLLSDATRFGLPSDGWPLVLSARPPPLS